MIDIPKEVVYDLYFNKNYTKKQLINYFNCSERVIDNRFKWWGWKFRSSGAMVGAFMKNKSKLKGLQAHIKKLYIEDKKTCKEIGEMYGLAETTIARFLKVNNVPIRQLRDAQVKRISINKDEIYDLYVNKKLSCQAIGKKYNCGDEVIRKILIGYDIERREKDLVFIEDNMGARGVFKYGTPEEKAIIGDKIAATHRKYWEDDIDELIKDRGLVRVSKIKKKSVVALKCLQHDHVFDIKVAHLIRGSGCPLCRFRSEALTYQSLLKIYSNIEVIRNYKLCSYVFDNAEHNAYVDFYLEVKNKKVVIEYQGAQHYYPVFFSGKTNGRMQKTLIRFEMQKFRDIFIREYCKDNGILLIEIDGREYNIENMNIEEHINKKLKEMDLC